MKSGFNFPICGSLESLRKFVFPFFQNAATVCWNLRFVFQRNVSGVRQQGSCHHNRHDVSAEISECPMEGRLEFLVHYDFVGI